MNAKADLLQQLTRPLLETAVLVNKMQNGELPLLTGLHFIESQLATIRQDVQTLQVIAKGKPLL